MKYYIINKGRLGTHAISEAMTKEQAQSAINVYDVAMDDYECIIDESGLETAVKELNKYKKRFGRDNNRIWEK